MDPAARLVPARALGAALLTTLSVLPACRQPVTETAADPSPDAAPADPLPPPRTLDSGVVIEEVVLGDGAEAQAGSVVQVHYRGELLSGEVFDQTDPHGPPAEFQLTKLIRGWQQGVPGLRVGGTRRLTIPSKLAYGPREVKDGAGTVIIPPHSDLRFEITLVGLK